MVVNDVNTVINLKELIYCFGLVKEKGPFVQHYEAVASLLVITPSIHHSLAWQLEVYQLENWSIKLQLSHHYSAELRLQVVTHLEDLEWAPINDLHTTKQLFIWLILVKGERPFILKAFSLLYLALRHFHVTHSAHY